MTLVSALAGLYRLPSPLPPCLSEQAKEKARHIEPGSLAISQSPTKSAAAGAVRRGETSGILKPGSQKG